MTHHIKPHKTYQEYLFQDLLKSLPKDKALRKMRAIIKPNTAFADAKTHKAIKNYRAKDHLVRYHNNNQYFGKEKEIA